MKSETRPPRLFVNLLERFCDPALYEGISGDLEESFYQNIKSIGPGRARVVFALQSVGFLRLIFKKKEKNVMPMRSIWHNYFLATFRSIKKHKSYFAINLVGLILAITCGWFAMVYIQDELQYDQIHSDKDQIYRLYKRNFNPNENRDYLTYETSGMMAPTMSKEYPEVEAFSRFCPWFDGVVVSYERTNISTKKLYLADENFFEFFDFQVLSGNPAEFLKAPSSIVLSNSLARALFGNENPMGKAVVGLNDLNYTVTGVFEDVPRHSSMDFEAVVSWSTTVPNVGPLSYNWMNNWLAQGIFSFVRLGLGTNPELLTEKLPDMMQRHFPERADQYTLQLISLNDMYLSSDRIRDSRGTRNGSKTFIAVMGFSALLILIIASLNYINITLSKATQTRHEVGIRKVLGSSRKQLMGRFMMETFLSTLIATVVSLVIIFIWLPDINMLIDKELPLEAFLQPISLGVIVLFMLVICLVVGSYPAWVMSAPQIASILKGDRTKRGRGVLKKLLLTIQYAISILLMICTIFIMRQINYLESKPLGFEKEHLLVIDVDNEVGQKAEVFESELLKNPNILDVSTSRSAIGAGSYTTTILPEGTEGETSVRIFGVDGGFFDVYGIKTQIGRTFIRNSVADSANMIVNRAFVEQLGWDDPIGKKIRFSPEGSPYPIIGVVEDFHYSSLASNHIEPMVLYLNPVAKRNTSVKVSGDDVRGTIAHIESVWDQLANRSPLSLYFVDDWFDDLYQKERQLYKVSMLYSIISIVLCALGLYGLTSLQLQQRLKEISIRKVLGASVNSLVGLINRQFVMIVFISFILMVPLGYFLMANWLASFAYHISIDLGPFAWSGLIVFATSFLIITILSTRAANTNPSKNLKVE